jgi:hypothetical protein
MVASLIRKGSLLNITYKMNAPACIAEAVEDDLIVINLNTGRYYNMRHETVATWRALTQGVAPEQLIAANNWSADQTSRFKAHVQHLLDEQILVPSVEQIEVPAAPCIEINHAHEPFQVDVFTDMEEMLLLDPIHDASTDAGWPHKA